MVQLPPELLDAVFTELDSYKKQDLRSCSLVCHVWSALSRPHLFRQVTYTLRDNSKCPETISNLRAAFRNILTFFEEHPEFAIYTQELNLKTIPVLNRHEWLIPPDAGYHDPAAFLSLLGLFSRLEHLRIQDVFVTSSPSAQIDCKLISLKSLAIESVQEEIPPSDVIHLLNCFKEIGSLDIAVFCYYSYRRVEDNYPTSRHLAVHSLVTRGSTSGGLFLHIVQTPSARVLHTLSLGNLETSFFPGLQELLTVTRSSLAYLRLSFCGFWQDERGTFVCGINIYSSG
ncbi:uncharacterized protein PHACADRAFT_262502 [Phanerochaete carnosa HHB-10118-sp]|uniref:F-box domain-containing protein n=1 Tax=Phanerochaete carnosa (strain HHB-10118-sp) TaxID=650164 RepID=K5VZK4_PHACS|nr:uncharacterized protein PHACADRAFT_262502 [Phanerochaete carnosa HHB-10118-sp]EKM52049.1 hypothetical protein PHACADRAFT_262502 [Phanerochaete carnosa HHB-10118-sp]